MMMTPAILIPVESVAQSGQSLKAQEYHYYFVLGSEIRDIRDFSSINTEMLQARESIAFRSKDGQHLLAGSHQSRTYSSYDLSGKLQHRFQLLNKTAIIGPGWTHYIYIKDNDIWAADLNWQTGKEANHRQLTQLGTFKSYSGIGFSHWYENRILMMLGGVRQRGYMLNTTTGELKDMIPTKDYFYKDYTYYQSPTGRYLWIKDHIIDLKTFTAWPQPPLGTMDYWQNDSTILRFGHHQTTTLLNIISGEQHPAFPVERHSMEYERGKVQNQWQPSRWFSPSGRYFLFTERDASDGKRIFFIGDTQTHQRMPTGIKVENGTSISREPIYFQWIDDGRFVYVNKGDAITQGVWWYDLHQKKHQKITPYITQEIVILRKAGKIVFVANNQLYRVDANGENLTQLNQQPLDRWNQKITTFLNE